MAGLLTKAWLFISQSFASSPNPKEAIGCNPITPPIQDKTMVRELQAQSGTTTVKDLAALGVSAPNPNPVSNRKKRPPQATFDDATDSDSDSFASDEDPHLEESEDDEEVIPESPPIGEQQRKRGATDSDDYRVHRPKTKKKKKHSVGKTGRSRDAYNELQKTLEATKNALKRERSIAAAAQEEVKTLKDELEVAKATTSKKTVRYRKKADLKTPLVKRLEKETRAFFTYDAGRKIKFLNAKHKIWSTKENTLCQMVVSALHWPAVHENNENFKRITWDNILAPLLTSLLTEHKNKIHQRMRATFNR